MAKHQDTLLVRIPFDGFYESLWSSELDREEEQAAEWEAERQGEDGIPRELRLEASDFASIFFDVTDYGKRDAATAKTVCDAFSHWADEAAGFKLGLTFESMTSPKYYNFETDRLFAHMPVKTAKRLFALSKKEKHEALKALIAQRFTSRSGFHSHYDNELSEWLSKPVTEWDHNELGTLLEAVTRYNEEGDTGDTGRWAVYYAATDCDGLHHEWSNAVDWAAFAERVAARREELAEGLRAADPDYVPPASRPSLGLRALSFAGRLGLAAMLWACLGAFAAGLPAALSWL